MNEVWLLLLDFIRTQHLFSPESSYILGQDIAIDGGVIPLWC